MLETEKKEFAKCRTEQRAVTKVVKEHARDRKNKKEFAKCCTEQRAVTKVVKEHVREKQRTERYLHRVIWIRE
jgi:hypothetical protein